MKYKSVTAIFLTGKDKKIQEKVKNPKSSNTDGIIISFWIFGKVSVTRDESVLTRCGKTKLSNISNNVTRRNSWASSLYPEEWPYRMDSSFEDICGKNIAIDTDDLVLANENMSLVIGTYGNRGKEAPTDWKKHFA